MDKVELLLPAGKMETLRAAVTNGADAVYLGLDRFSARTSAGNFDEQSFSAAVSHCHKHGVKVYVTMNTLIKNDELEDYFRELHIISESGADAVIIQDRCLIPDIKKNFPDLSIHLSTQATITNSSAIPDGVDRVILARELGIDEIKDIAADHEVEVFAHGALCFSYSGQCLFSSLVGGRSGNRGCCAQPCRLEYNNKFLLSTKDLCLLSRIPDLIKAGVISLKVEGRMRSPIYVATVARIYRKVIDSYYEGNFKVDELDIQELMLVFNRGFTEGFGSESSIVDSRKPMNRGLYLGFFKEGKLKLKAPLKVGDGVSIWKGDDVIGFKVPQITVGCMMTKVAKADDIIWIDSRGAKDGDKLFKTSAVDANLDLGDDIEDIAATQSKPTFRLPITESVKNNDKVKIFAKAYNMKSAIAADKAQADVIYYDILKDDFEEVKNSIKHAKLFAMTSRILSDKQLKSLVAVIKKKQPDGILISDVGLYHAIKNQYKKDSLHLDYSFNTFNDIDIAYYDAIPILSPELNKDEVAGFNDKNTIAFIHGDIIVMTTREPLKAPELIDKDGRHFRVRKSGDVNEILGSKQLGLFNKARDYLETGIRYFLIDVNKDVDKYIRIYRKILSGDDFDDKKISKGYTTGHFDRGVK